MEYRLVTFIPDGVSTSPLHQSLFTLWLCFVMPSRGEERKEKQSVESIQLKYCFLRLGMAWFLNWTAACFYYALYWRVWNDRGEKHFGAILQCLEHLIFNDYSTFVLSSCQSSTVVHCLFAMISNTSRHSFTKHVAFVSMSVLKFSFPFFFFVSAQSFKEFSQLLNTVEEERRRLVRLQFTKPEHDRDCCSSCVTSLTRSF